MVDVDAEAEKGFAPMASRSAFSLLDNIVFAALVMSFMSEISLIGWEEHVETSDKSVRFEEIKAAEAEAGAAAALALAAAGAGTGCGGM